MSATAEQIHSVTERYRKLAFDRDVQAAIALSGIRTLLTLCARLQVSLTAEGLEILLRPYEEARKRFQEYENSPEFKEAW